MAKRLRFAGHRAAGSAGKMRRGTELRRKRKCFDEGFMHRGPSGAARRSHRLRNRLVASEHERGRIQPRPVAVRAAGGQPVSDQDRVLGHRAPGAFAIRLQVVRTSPELQCGARSRRSAYAIRRERKRPGQRDQVVPSIPGICVKTHPRCAKGKSAAFAGARRIHRIGTGAAAEWSAERSGGATSRGDA